MSEPAGRANHRHGEPAGRANHRHGEPAGRANHRHGEPDLALRHIEAHRSYREGVVEVLRAALVAGQMKPGRLYSAPTLAVQLGVSATPVREAMSELAAQGLVEVVRNRGFRVRELSDIELDEITQLRLLIEVPTMVDIARSCEAEAIEAIRPLARAIERAARRSDLIAYVEADRRFHLALLSLAGNRQLVEIVDQLRAKARLHGIDGLAAHGLLIRSADEHGAILDRLVANDVEGTERLMRRHLA
jgi:DNA-binding GntR family transcriptional regulator